MPSPSLSLLDEMMILTNLESSDFVHIPQVAVIVMLIRFFNKSLVEAKITTSSTPTEFIPSKTVQDSGDVWITFPDIVRGAEESISINHRL